MQVVTYIEIDVPTFVRQSPDDTQTFRFAMPTNYLSGDIDAIPSVDSISFTPARVSLGKDLGQRASLKISFNDHRHVFNGEPYAQGTFWGKWRGRYGATLRGRALRLIRGVVGQTIEEMETRHYVVEGINGPTPDGKCTIEAKDILKLADDDRAQAPLLTGTSIGGVAAGVNEVATIQEAGGGSLYPATGYVCLGGKEVAEYTRDGQELTLITRGLFGTSDQAHDAGDRAQIVLRYDGDTVSDIIYELLTTYAGISASYIDKDDWDLEESENLNVIYAATITEPTSVNKLVSELVEQAALALYWDDKARQIKLQVLREISTDADTFDETRMIEGSLQVAEQPSKRVSRVWTFYGQRDPTDSGGNEDNYRSALVDVDYDKEIEYGSASIRKILARWVETETAATRLNSLQLSRYRDPPRMFQFDLLTTESIALAAGYTLRWWGNQDEEGNEASVKIQVTQISVHADRIHVEAEEMLASGVVVLVHVVFLTTAGSLDTYTWDETWNDSDNSIVCLGGGAGGRRRDSGAAGGGGGGGAYSRTDNYARPSPTEATSQYYVGDGGGQNTSGEDTYFGAALFADSVCAAEGGTTAPNYNGGAGGDASNGIGDVKYSGGHGGNVTDSGFLGNYALGGGGGGGAAGPHGDGARGGNNSQRTDDGGSGGGGADGGYAGSEAAGSGTTGGNGGNNRFDYGGGNASTPDGDEGGGGKGGNTGGDGGDGGTGEQIWTQTVSPIISAGPGGGGGGGGEQGRGGDGGLYGGGGGGSYKNTAGSGKQGLIVLRWRE